MERLVSTTDNFDEFGEFSREAEEKRLKLLFRDFLIAPEISGSSRSYSANHRIPAEKVTDRGEVIEVARDPIDDETHEDGTVLVHRDDDNMITRIEIVCSCGKRTIVRLEDDGSDNAGEGDNPQMNFAGKYSDSPDFNG